MVEGKGKRSWVRAGSTPSAAAHFPESPKPDDAAGAAATVCYFPVVAGVCKVCDTMQCLPVFHSASSPHNSLNQCWHKEQSFSAPRCVPVSRSSGFEVRSTWVWTQASLFANMWYWASNFILPSFRFLLFKIGIILSASPCSRQD